MNSRGTVALGGWAGRQFRRFGADDFGAYRPFWDNELRRFSADRRRRRLSTWERPSTARMRQCHSRFRTGQLHVSPYLLEAIPRHAFVQAIIRHVTDERPLIDGQPIRSDFRHADITFHLETAADRQSTAIRLS